MTQSSQTSALRNSPPGDRGNDRYNSILNITQNWSSLRPAISLLRGEFFPYIHQLAKITCTNSPRLSSFVRQIRFNVIHPLFIIINYPVWCENCWTYICLKTVICVKQILFKRLEATIKKISSLGKCTHIIQ